METENIHVKQFRDVAQRVLKVTVLKFQSSASPGFFERIFGNSTMMLTIKCKDAIGPNEYSTSPFQCDRISNINESFVFVLQNENVAHEEDDQGSKSLGLEVTLFRGYNVDGKEIIDVNKYSEDEPQKLIIPFGEKMKVAVELEHAIKKTYDFRYSCCPCDKELLCLRQRKKRIFSHLQSLLKENGPTTFDEVPTVALLFSGGGYRATIQSCGAMEAFQDGGILDAISYISGLSGGAWYLITSYAKQSLGGKEDILKLHSGIKDAVKCNMAWQSITDIQNLIKCWKYTDKKSRAKQPLSFVDLYGHRLGKNLLGSELENKKMSDLAPYVETGRVPIPIVTAIHVRSNVSTSLFYNDLEITPWEVSMPNFGINMSPGVFGSEWYRGILIRRCSENPLHFILGLTSNAFGIQFKYLFDGETTEVDPEFVKLIRNHEIGRHRTKRFTSIRKRMSFKRRITTRGSNTASSSHVNESLDTRPGNNNNDRKIPKEPRSGSESLGVQNTEVEVKNGTEETENMLHSLWKKMKKYPIFTDREAIMDRTAKVLNCLTGFRDIPYFTLSGEQRQPKNEAFCKSLKKCFEEDNMSIMDAAVTCNVPTNAVLRSQRNADILIVCDATESENDQVIDYFELFNAEKKAREQGLKFPHIDKRKLEAGPRNEIHVFEDENDPECPIVIWITLCNKSYKSLENVTPPPLRRGEESYELPEHEKFNNFSMFGPGSVYQTTTLRYSSLQFDRLRELMRYNVEKNIEAIKREISKKISQRREKMHLATTS